MMRLLYAMLLTFFSSVAFAAEEVPSLFEPAAKDISIYYLGAIFGNHLVPGGTDMHLLSDMFKVFNQIVISVGLIVIIYTIITSIIYSAAQGKPLGEKWSGVWLPIRTVLGVSLLIPKAGTGYCMAQYLVMWLTVQGVGAADSLWSMALDYFIKGGAIYSNTTEKSSSHMNKTTVDTAYNFERYILINTSCVAAHNRSENEKLYGKYDIYSTDDYTINFGNEEVWDPSAPNEGGRECGYILMPTPDDELSPGEQDLILQTYNRAFTALAEGLMDPGKFLASDEGADDLQWGDHFTTIKINAVNFIEYLNGAQQILFPGQQLTDSQDEYRKKLQDLKQYGWAIAGNYYVTLSTFTDEIKGITLNIPDTLIENPKGAPADEYADAIKNAQDFWKIEDTSDPRRVNTFEQWTAKYDNIPGYSETPIENPSQTYNGLNKQQIAELEKYVRQLGSFGAGGGKPIEYMGNITGFGDEHVVDPLLRASLYGKELTDQAVQIAIIFFSIMIGTALIGIIPCTPGWFITVPLIIFGSLMPMVMSLAGFLYMQGVLLGVTIPFVPFIIFLVGVLGWFLAVIESVVAAPLVAVGLIFPETQQEIWGRAEPAYMMILNLFMRPSLMIMGFMAGLILTWVGVDLLNAAFYLFVVDAAQIETMFGWLVVTMVYVGILLTVVTKTFGLINDLPNKTLMWIGDKSMQQEGAGEMLGAAKAGAEKGGQAIAGGMSAAGSGAGQLDQSVAKHAKKREGAAVWNTALSAVKSRLPW
jgi:hypothetical protein